MKVSVQMLVRNQKETYVRPKHALGPIENGWLASSMSVLFDPSQRSGSKFQGSLKLVADMLAAKGLVFTSVCKHVNVAAGVCRDLSVTYASRYEIAIDRVPSFRNDPWKS